MPEMRDYDRRGHYLIDDHTSASYMVRSMSVVYGWISIWTPSVIIIRSFYPITVILADIIVSCKVLSSTLIVSNLHVFIDMTAVVCRRLSPAFTGMIRLMISHVLVSFVGRVIKD